MKRPIAMLSTALVAVALSGFAVTAAAAEDAPPPEVIEVIETPITEPEPIVLEETPPVEDVAQPLAAAVQSAVTWVTICHKPGTPAEQETKDVPAAAVDGHLGHGDYLGACLALEEEPVIDLTPYVLVAWTLPNDLPGPIWPGQLIKTSIDLSAGDLNALDDQLTQCGVDYQVDLYNDSEITAALIAGGVLNGPSNPAEDLAYGAVDGNPWKYVDNGDDCGPDVVECPVATVQPTSTNLHPQGWTLTAGEWIDGGVEFTASNWSDAYASKSVNFPLASSANLGFSTTGGTVWAIILVTDAGNVHYEPEPYSDDLWTNAAGILPANGGGQGGPYSGGLDDLLSNPTVTEVRLYFTSGSAEPVTGILHSGSFNCQEQPFDHENEVTPIPALFSAEPTPPDCEVDGSFNFSGEFPNVTVTVTPAYAGPGMYTIEATTDAGYEFPDGTTFKSIEVTILGQIATQSENPEAPCYLAPPEEPEEPVVPPALALTGADPGLANALAWGGLGVILLGIIALTVMVVRARRNNPVEH